MDTSITGISQFILAGNSTFTVKNQETGGRFTYKVTKPADFNENRPVWFVSVLSGRDNESSYSYMGIIRGNQFIRTKTSKISPDAISFKGFQWLWGSVVNNKELPSKVQFYHEGRCGRCGRKLTTPESVESGFGPHCIQLVGGYRSRTETDDSEVYDDRETSEYFMRIGV
jgi:hypothetical protein